MERVSNARVGLLSAFSGINTYSAGDTHNGFDSADILGVEARVLGTLVLRGGDSKTTGSEKSIEVFTRHVMGGGG
jgi:hypothetical protein